MQSIKELYKIGNGPSSSHTIGPKKAAEIFKNRNINADKFEVTLYGSLALTGKGHLTDYIIKKTLAGTETQIIFDTTTKCNYHPNTLHFIAFKNNIKADEMTVYSVGGGTIEIKGEEENSPLEVYPHKNFEEIKKYCMENNINLCEYVYKFENKEEIQNYISKVWNVMESSITEGLNKSDVIPGKLNLNRKAKSIFEATLNSKIPDIKKIGLISSYAYSVSEENASGGQIVTAPTCGSSGVLPAVLEYMKKNNNFSDSKIKEALIIAGLFGNIVKHNASISGAECGCQAEIGTACSMAAAAVAYLLNLDISQIENSAEIAMEHHLGLTCDPVYGYVQIPCIERNAVAAIRAIDSAYLAAINGKEKSRISFDIVVKTMYKTGQDLKNRYKETSNGGLAKEYLKNKTSHI